MAQARQHLLKAIDYYEAAIAIDPSNLIAQLGRAWCLDQAGDRQRAVAAYRDILKALRGRENRRNLPPFQNFTPMTVEVAEYLIPLLDPIKMQTKSGMLSNVLTRWKG